MAKRPSPARPSPAKRSAKARAPRSSDARDLGFGEAPQAAFEGEPVAFDPMSISSWASDIAHEAEAEKIAREADEISGVRNEVEEEAERLARDGKVKAPARGRVRSETGSTRSKRAGGGSKTSDGDLKNGRTSRGTSMSPTGASPSERAAAGFQPIAGMDIDIDEAERLLAQAHGQAAPPTSKKADRGKAQSDRIMSKDKVVTREVDLDAKAGTSVAEGGVTATVQALQDLIATGNPLHQKQWVPHRPDRPAKSEGGVPFKIVSDFEPAGDQPTAIAELVDGLKQNERMQTLLGVTGSGKTYTMAKVIEETQRPALILAPNKTLAAQLYGEMKNFFPDNAVEYFVSYYDYYQPEAYVPRSDTYIEKESTINEQIDRMRHSATRALLERDDVIIVASVSCIYGIGSVETYTAMTFGIEVGDRIDQRQLLADLVAQQYKRNDINFVRGSFRVRGDTIEIFPAHLEDSAWRISLFGDEVEQITEFDPLTGQKTDDLKSVKIYANSHYVTPRPTLSKAISAIKAELKGRLDELESAGRLLEAQRLEQRTRYDLEMLEATGSCQGIENYSRYLTGRRPGDPPPTLFEYVPDNAIVFIDESHVTVSQIGAMYRGDFRRKATLAEYGFRLPSCMDNRPLRFEEWDAMRPETVAVSATPAAWELEQSGGVFAEQVIRPTGLVDPPVEVRPVKAQVDDVLDEIRQTAKAGYRTLCTVLTKRMAEDLTEYLHEQGVRVRYMHSDIDTIERIEILRDLRLGAFDVLVGINLLREGLDIPECGLVAILDADKEGFLRSETSLIQTIGRAARNVDGKVILYADRITGSMERAMAETSRRREKQLAWNEANGITPESVKARIADILESPYEADHVTVGKGVAEEDGQLIGGNMRAHIEAMEKKMLSAASDLDFEEAARLRDEIKRLREVELEVADDPLSREAGIENTRDARSAKAKGRAAPSTGAGTIRGRDKRKDRFRKNDLDEMTVGRTEKPRR